MQARYYNGWAGRFISQDPTFLNTGSNKFENDYNIPIEKYLSDPQLLNSYSYGRNNPIIQTDKNGEIIDTIADIGFIGYDLYSLLGKAYYSGESTKGKWASLGLDVGGALIPGVTGLGLGMKAVKSGAEFAGDTNKILDAAKSTKWANPKTLLDHFSRHGADFGAKSIEDYAKSAQELFKNSDAADRFVGKDGTVRVYDKVKNIFGSFTKSGETKTFYKPDPAIHGFKTNTQYWNSLKNKLKR